MSNVRVRKNIACADSLIKQKVSLTLAFLGLNLVTALEDEHGSKAKVTWSVLRMLNDCIIQLLFTVKEGNGFKNKEAVTLTYPRHV